MATTTDYTIGATLDLPYNQAVVATRSALADVGFGVLTEIDIRATMKQKLDVDVPPQVILGACRPQLAHRAITAEPAVAALLPCNVVVRAINDGQTQVEAADPRAMLQLAGPSAAEVAAEAHSRLSTALSALVDEHPAR